MVSLSPDAAVIAPKPGLREAATVINQPRYRQQLEQLLREVTGVSLRVDVQTGAAVADIEEVAPPPPRAPGRTPSPSPGPAAPPPRAALTREQREAAMNLPTVKELQQLFDLTLIDVRPDDDAPA